MQKFRSQTGFTMIEMMIVVAIMGIVMAFAIPSVTAYRIKEEARSNAHVVAGALRNARDRAIREGVQHFELFPDPTIAPNAPVARVVRDADNNWTETPPGDVARNVFFNRPTSPDVTPYGIGARGDSDQAVGTLAVLPEGASFPIDPGSGRPGVGFTERGVPVSLATPGTWGSGAGAYYVTDNARSVYAVELGPLGEIRVGSLDGAAGIWR